MLVKIYLGWVNEKKKEEDKSRKSLVKEAMTVEAAQMKFHGKITIEEKKRRRIKVTGKGI